MLRKRPHRLVADSPEEVGEEQDPEEVGERFIELLRNLEDEDLPDGPISEEEKKEEQVSPKRKRLKKSSKNKGSIFFSTPSGFRSLTPSVFRWVAIGTGTYSFDGGGKAGKAKQCQTC
jgi:hypothetical protein